ncbi:MAG TPA: hypothetical protein VKU41_27195 [Polyangiaceae bacterium]|nr:hypothetical protein [Polyangiaceae bacterium]
MHLRRVVAAAVALFALLSTSRARAWQEAHQVGDDVEVRVESDGTASVRHLLKWGVAHGPLRWIDLIGVDPSVDLAPEVAIEGDRGRTWSAHTVRLAPGPLGEGIVRIAVDDPRALMRGTFTFEVRWRVDLVAGGVLVKDGGTWRLSFGSPPAADGFEGAKTTFDFPAAPDAPRPIRPDTGLVDDGVVASVRREGDRDQLELVRPHVGRSESVRWTVRVDAHALSRVPGPASPAVAEIRTAPEPDRVRGVSLLALLAALGGALGTLVWRKARSFDAACGAYGGVARGLLPGPVALRAAVAGAALAGAVGLQTADEALGAAVLVALAVLAAAIRAPRLGRPARGPGRWLMLRPDDAFLPRDAATEVRGPPGWAVPVALALVSLAAVVARRFSAEGPWLVLLDSAPLVALAATGRRSQLPPHGARDAVPWLLPSFRRLRAIDALRAVPWARVAAEGAAFDELRLLVLPRVAIPGLLGIEVALAWGTTPVGWAPTPEILVRFLEGSAAAALVSTLMSTVLSKVAPSARPSPGRRPDERVVRLSPSASSPSSVVALVRALAHELTDRRAASPAEATRTALERRSLRPLPAPPRPFGAGAPTC